MHYKNEGNWPTERPMSGREFCNTTPNFAGRGRVRLRRGRRVESGTVGKIDVNQNRDANSLNLRTQRHTIFGWSRPKFWGWWS